MTAGELYDILKIVDPSFEVSVCSDEDGEHFHVENVEIRVADKELHIHGGGEDQVSYDSR